MNLRKTSCMIPTLCLYNQKHFHRCYLVAGRITGFQSRDGQLQMETQLSHRVKYSS